MTTTQPHVTLPVVEGNDSAPSSGQAGPGGRLLKAIEGRTARVGVIGLGYVGLPLVELFAKGGFPALDVDEAKVGYLQTGHSDIGRIDSRRAAALRDQGRLEATSDFARLAFDWDFIVRQSSFVVDTRGATRGPARAAVGTVVTSWRRRGRGP